jgi:hypothetical protein
MFFSFGTFAPSQIYPLSAHNCMNFYGTLMNNTAGDPSSYTQVVDSQGTLMGMYGTPNNGSLFQLDSTVL